MFIKQFTFFEAFCRKACISKFSPTEERANSKVLDKGEKNSQPWVLYNRF